MKKSLQLLIVGAASLATSFLASCALPFPVGALYTDFTYPVTVGEGDIKYNRCGTASCYSLFGWVAGGDASLNRAAKNGNIDKISWANMKAFNILGIYGKYTVEVYGTGSKFGPDENYRPEKIAEEN